ncbi:MAG: redoxin domain-containing protein, partial [Bacteroidota bacterium]|nr:redoxin domain-containing protein [Bacteroidota bacterium]
MIVRQVLLFGFFVSTTLAYTVGDTVRDFQLRNVDGKMVALTQYATTGRGVIIVFTCNSCPYAKAYEERIIELHREFAPK